MTEREGVTRGRGRGREKKRIITMGMTAANERGQRRDGCLCEYCSENII